MDRLADNLNFFIESQKNSWKGFWIYRSQFLIWAMAEVLVILNMVVAITVIYSVSNGIHGWSYFQILALSSVSVMVFGVFDYLVIPWNIVNKLRNGSMDMWFTKPYSYLLILSSNFGNVTAFAGFLGGLLLFIYSAMHLGLQAMQMVYFSVLFIAGTIAFYLFLTMLTILAYHLFRSGQFVDNMENMLGNVGRYPLSIYGIIGQLAFTLVIPIGIAYYYPAEALLGTISPAGFAAAFLLSVVIAIASRQVFYMLVRNYSSGGG